ncbi:carotenoid oxygenase family protein [Crocosphaera chwakensis]|uniref:Retinal pigment epithelial membrane protein n=1 Tax=Crocosphaera chwakensis CCY0110 TaxID=391612 RepID=A3IL68_9CHRO|nr:carotenoid oxygenase family protein [Crocosphaera chwakensis]EAZ92937.1 Retinal pigment epithelial membrane protein [Crocosphaera chwakensis CCY0110]
MTATIKINPYLSGNFAPVSREITAHNLTVTGEIPKNLRGMFLRNGPNPQFSPIGEYHWFDGDGMIHGVHIEDGKVSYRNRFVQTRGYCLEKEANKPLWTGMLEPPQMDNPYGPLKNTANTALVYHADRLLALWEGGEPHALMVPELDTLGSYNFDGKLTSPFTAHPKIDPVTGEMMFFGYSMIQPPYLQYGIVSSQGELLKTVPIDLPVGVMMHDFAITENYTIFLDLPFTFRPDRMQKGESPLKFENDTPSRFGIVPRQGNNEDIRWFESNSCYIFHTLNAYEKGDEIVLIACRMNATTVLGEATEETEESDIPHLHEWHFNLKTGEVKEQKLCDLPSEFPRINEQYTGRKTCYGYSGKMADSSEPKFNGIIKHDFEKGGFDIHHFGRHRYGSEPIFAPNPDAEKEDEGWLLTFIHDEGSNTSELVIIDAQDFTASPIAKIQIPQRVPYGFHGMWLAQ